MTEAVFSRSEDGPGSTDGRGRFLAKRSDGVAPLIEGATPVGRPSPSPSMLVERYDFSSRDWHTHIHVDQVVALYLKPANVRHVLESSSNSSLLPLGPELATICQRERPESVFWNEAASFLCVRVNDTALDEAARFLLGRNRVEIKSSSRVADVRLTSLLHAIETEREHEYPAGRLFLDGIENALASTLVGSYSRETSATQPKIGGLAPHRFRRVLEFMHANIDRHIGLEALAQCAGLSLSHFSHQFRKSANLSPHRYMLRLRIERSKTLLRDRGLSILDVALAVGFENAQHFATVFSRIEGASPSSYRRNL